MTMPARYPGPAFMAELEAAGGDFTRLSNTVAARDGAFPSPPSWPTCAPTCSTAGSLREAGWTARSTHCVIDELDIVEAVPLERRVPAAKITRVLALVAGPDMPNMFGVDLDGVELRADDLVWSVGSGPRVTGPAQALALAACGRLLPAGRLGGAGREPLHAVVKG